MDSSPGPQPLLAINRGLLTWIWLAPSTGVGGGVGAGCSNGSYSLFLMRWTQMHSLPPPNGGLHGAFIRHGKPRSPCSAGNHHRLGPVMQSSLQEHEGQLPTKVLFTKLCVWSRGHWG